jgi:hypothetical protein
MDKVGFTNCGKYTLDFSNKPGHFIDSESREFDEISRVTVKVPDSWKKGIIKTLGYQCEQNVLITQLEAYLHRQLSDLPKTKDTWVEREEGYIFDTETTGYFFDDVEIIDESHFAVTLRAEVDYTAENKESGKKVHNTAFINVSIF